MKKLVFVTIEDGKDQLLWKIMEDFKKTKALKKYEIIISNKRITPLDPEQTLEICGALLKCAEKMIK